MSVANYDSSDVTRFRKARALYAFKNANVASVATGQSVLPYQGPPPMNVVRIDTNLGGGTVWRDGCAIHAGCATNCPTSEPVVNCQGAPAATGGV
jgi:hypothetical protein